MASRSPALTAATCSATTPVSVLVVVMTCRLGHPRTGESSPGSRIDSPPAGESILVRVGTRVSIGDLARASQLSVKTLRHYHEVGLLAPNEVNPDNGYRYYSQDQIQAAQVIRRLRGLQMPVTDVKAALDATDSELRDLLERPQTARPIEHRTVAPTPGAGIQATVDREDALAWWRGALGELHATVQAQALATTGPSGGLYAGEIFQYGRGEATVFIPTAGPVKPIGRVAQVVIPAAELA